MAWPAKAPPAGNGRQAQPARPVAWHLTALCLAVMLPVLALAAVLAWSYEKAEQARLRESGLRIAHDVADVLDLDLAQLLGAADTLARSHLISDSAGTALSQVKWPLDATLAVYDRDGRLLDGGEGSGQRPSGAMVSAPERALLQGPQPIVSDLVTAPLAPRAEVRVEIRLGEDTGRAGFLSLEVAAERLQEPVRRAAGRIPAGATWIVAVVDRRGAVVARTDGQAASVGQPIAPVLWAAIQQDREGTIRQSGARRAEDAMAVAFSPVRSAGWTVVVTEPARVAEAPLTRFLSLTATVAALLIMLSGGLGLAVARRITRPVAMLTDAAARLGRGEAVPDRTSGVREVDAAGKALADAAVRRAMLETDLRASEARFRALFEAAPLAVALIDPETLSFTAVNHCACKLLGYPPEEFSRLGLPDIDATMSEAELRACAHDAALADTQKEFETRHRTRTGEIRDVLVRTTRVSYGGLEQLCSAWVDITARRAAEAEMARVLESQRAILDGLPAHIALLDAQGRIVAVNKAWREFGEAHAPGSAVGVGADYLATCMPAARAGDADALTALEGIRGVLDGRRDRVELVYPCPSPGGELWFQMIAVPAAVERRAGRPGGGAVVMHTDVSRRVQAEQALTESEARLRLAIEATELGVWDQDLVSGLSVWNDRSYRILGLEPSAAPADLRFWRQRVHPDDREEFERLYQTALSSGNELFQFEHRVIRSGGEIRWIRPLGRIVRDANGAPARFIGVFSDITALKQASEGRERLLQLVEGSSDFIGIADAAGRLSYLNRGGRRMVGLDDDADITTLHFIDYVAPLWRGFFQTIVLPTARETGLWEGEMQLINLRSGALIDVYRSTFSMRDRNGQLAGYATVTRDITAAKRAEMVLAEREALLRSILETVPDGMVLFDEHGTIESFSSTAETLFGWPAAEAIGRNVSILMPAEEHARLQDYLRTHIAAGERRLIGAGQQATGQRRDGSTFPVELSISELRVDNRRLFTGFISDLTEQQATQTRLQGLHAELAHLSRLSAAGAMASVLAHELNQPLTAIASAVRAARRMLIAAGTSAVSPALQEAMDLTAEQSLRAGQIIRRLRDFVSSGGETEKRPESLAQMMEEASALALLGTKDSGVHVSFQLPLELPLLLVDRVQIQQVLVNLMRNAVQAMTEEQPDTTVPERRELTISARLAGAETVEVCVADTGPGLAPEVMERLFEPFVTTKASGMGLGLSICRSIIEAHGGQLWADANPGGGTVFRFTLPTAPSQLSQAERSGA